VGKSRDEDRRTVYAAVASRRLQQDSLVWEVPIVSFTAQAFLFTIALGPDSSQLARTVSALLAAGISLMCVTLMRRHRQLETSDAIWMSEREKELGVDYEIHAMAWWRSTLDVPVRATFLARWVPAWRAYNAWIIALSTIGSVALGIVVVTWLWPQLLEGIRP
jgi:hypothetical protein